MHCSRLKIGLRASAFKSVIYLCDILATFQPGACDHTFPFVSSAALLSPRRHRLEVPFEVDLRSDTIHRTFLRMATYEIVMIRHGESTWNQENKFCGW